VAEISKSCDSRIKPVEILKAGFPAFDAHATAASGTVAAVILATPIRCDANGLYCRNYCAALQPL